MCDHAWFGVAMGARQSTSPNKKNIDPYGIDHLICRGGVEVPFQFQAKAVADFIDGYFEIWCHLFKLVNLPAIFDASIGCGTLLLALNSAKLACDSPFELRPCLSSCPKSSLAAPPAGMPLRWKRFKRKVPFQLGSSTARYAGRRLAMGCAECAF